MTINPYILERISRIPSDPNWDSDRRNPGNAEIYADFFTDPARYEFPDSIAVRDETVPGPHGAIPVRIYQPTDASGAPPALLWNHGGGFTGGGLDMTESHVTGAEIAARAGAVVVAVDYRLANDGARYPVPLDDVVAAWTWLADLANELEVDARRLSSGGASAGANLAAAAVLRLRDNDQSSPAGLLLAYPSLHFPLPALDDEVHAVMATLPPVLRARPATVAAMYGNYAGRISDLPPEVIPGNARLQGFPSTRILISEYDDFRPSGELFAQQLAEAGVPVETHLAAGMLHGHLNRTPVLEEVSRSLDFFATALGEPHSGR